MIENRVEYIADKLKESFNTRSVEVIDESHLHAGHAGARDGKGHFKVIIRSNVFLDKSLIERHRMIYAVLQEALETDIHALSIEAKTEQE